MKINSILSNMRNVSSFMQKMIFAAAIVLLGSLNGWGQTTVTIGNTSGGTTRNYPISPYYNYSYSQQIILQSEIATQGSITQIKFYSNGTAFANSRAWTIYMGHTTKTNFSSTSDWVALANLTEVYSGTVSTPSGAGWYTITLDTEFNYNNSNNLVIALDENGSGFDGSSSSRYFYYSNVSATNRVIYYESDGTNPNPSSPPSATSRASYLNSMQLVINQVPTNPTFSNTGSSSQLAFNNSYINDNTPLFRASATHTASFDRFQVEINTNSTFTGTAYTQTFSGTYASGTQYDLECNSLSPSFSPSDGVTYYVRVKASADGGTSYGSWSTGTYSFTYKTSGDPDWYQKESAQFQSGTVVAAGEDTYGNSGSSTCSYYGWNGYLAFIPITVTSSGTLQTLNAHLSSASGNIRMALYNSTYNLIAETNSVSAINGLNEISTTSNPTISAGTYYLAVQVSANGTYICHVGSGSTDTYYAYSYGSFPSTLTSSGSSDGLRLLLNITLTNESSTTSPPIQFASFVGASAFDDVTFTTSGSGTVNVGVYADAAATTQIIAPTTSSPIDISGINTTTYPSIYLKATLEGASPQLDSWKVTGAFCSNPSNGGVISDTQTICYNGDPSNITSSSAASGQTGTIEYKWQYSSSSDFSSDVNDIESTNSTTYDPPSGLTATRYYRRLARVTCKADWTGATASNIITVTVRSQFSPGAINTTGETICYNGNPAEITSSSAASGGDASYTYQWLYSAAADFSSPEVIASSNAANYDPPTGLTAARWYRRQAKDGTCNTSWETSTGTWAVALNDLPTTYNVEGGGAYCAGGSGYEISLDNSQLGVNYQLKRDGSNVGDVVAGLGGDGISFGTHTTAGTYTVLATNASTSCTNTMTGNAVITVNPLPTAFNVSGGGSYCSGGGGVEITLSDSETGVNYQLKRDGSNTGSPVAGDDDDITFGNQTTAGTYTVLATNASSSCTNTMTGSASVTVLDVPTKAATPSPSHEGTLIPIDAQLSWTNGGGATSYDVYFGDSSPGNAQGNQAGTSFDPGTLDSETEYFWRIDAKNTCGTTTGDVWSFTTANAAVCVAPSLNAKYNNEDSKSICLGDEYTLSANPTLAANCAVWEYAWYTGDGTGNTYWDGYDWDNAETWGAYETISDVSPSSTTTYKVKVRCQGDNDCNNGDAVGVTVTIRDAFNAGSISTVGETICYNGNPAEISTSTAATGGDNSISYQWQYATDVDFTSPQTIGSSNSASYDPPADLTENRWYRRQAKDGACNTSWTNSTGVYAVTVRSNFTAGTISTSNETICYNGNPAEITSSVAASGGDASITYRWQYSTDAGFSTPVDIASSNAATYDPASGLTANRWYRRQAKDGTCNTSWTSSTGIYAVTVRPEFTPGSISTTGETICYNGNPTAITSSVASSGGDASISYRWQYSTDAGFSSPQDIGSTNTASYNPPAGLTEARWYRRQAKDGTCNTSWENSTGTWAVGIHALPTAEISGTTTICDGNSTNLSVALTGSQPWTITYTDGVTPVEISNIVSSPRSISVSPSSNTTYTLTAVSDVNCTGTSYTGSAVITVNYPPSAPVSSAFGILGETSFRAHWQSVANATSYRLDVSTNSGFSSYVSGYQDRNVGDVTQYDVEGLTTGTIYYYRVRVVTDCGTSSNSETQTAFTKKYLFEVGSSKEYSTIQSAMDAVSYFWGSTAFDANVEVRVYNGTYNEAITANAALNPGASGRLLINAAADNAPVLNGGDTRTIGFDLTESYVTISGFTIRDYTSEGIKIAGGNNIITNNILYDNAGANIFINGGGNNNEISYNKTYNSSQNGIRVKNSTTANIYNNLAYNNQSHGIYLEDGANSAIVKNNTAYGNGGTGYLTWTDDFETDKGWSFSGSTIAGRGAVPSSCSGCVSGTPRSGSNILHMVRCGATGNSTASITLNVGSGGGTFSGYYKVSGRSYENRFEYQIDNNAAVDVYYYCQNTWTAFSFSVPEGTHTIHLRYRVTNTSSSQMAIIDDVQCTNVEMVIPSSGIYASSSTGITASNNILYAKDGGDYYAIGLDASSSLSATSGYNNLYSGGSKLANYGGVDKNDIASWNTSSPGDDDINSNPLFVNAASADFHLQSAGGRATGNIWPPTADPSGWTNDAATSPSINAGKTSDSYSNEPACDGGRINQGCYGNTAQASKSLYPDAAGTISGSPAVYQGQTGVTYSVGAITNATGYTWSYTGTGLSITGGDNTNAITVTFAGDATSGNLTVEGTNYCGSGTVSANYAITVGEAKFYSKSSGNLNELSSWGINSDGSGAAPGNFSNANQTFQIQNNASPTIGASWTVSGTGSKIIVGDGTNACEFTIPSNYVVTSTATDIASNATITRTSSASQSFGTLNVLDGGTYNHAYNGGTIPTATWAENSIFAVTGITSATSLTGLNQAFHHFTWNCASQTSAFNAAGNLTTVNGNLTISTTNSGSFIFASSQSPTIAVSGDLNMNGGTFTLSTSSGVPTINLNGDFNQSGGTINMQTSGTASHYSVINFSGNFNQTAGTITESGSGFGRIYFKKATGTQTFNQSGTISNDIRTYKDGAGTLELTSNVTLPGLINFSAGTLDFGTTARTFSMGTGNSISFSGCTVDMSGNNAAHIIRITGSPSSVTFPTTWTHGTADIFEFSNSGSIYLNQAITFNHLEVTGSGYVYFIDGITARTLNVLGNYTQTSGYFRMAESTGKATMNVSGDFILNGGHFRVDYSTAESILNISGDFEQNGGTLDLSNAAFAGSSISTLNMGGNFIQTSGTITESGSTLGLIQFSKTGTQTYSQAGTISNTVRMQVDAGSTLSLESNASLPARVSINGTLLFGNSERTFSLENTAADVLQGNGTIDMQNADHILDYKGSSIAFNGTFLAGNSGTVRFSRNGDQTMPNWEYRNLTTAGTSGTKSFGSNFRSSVSILGNLTVNGAGSTCVYYTSTTNGTDGILSIGGDLIVTAGTFLGTNNVSDPSIEVQGDVLVNGGNLYLSGYGAGGGIGVATYNLYGSLTRTSGNLYATNQSQLPDNVYANVNFVGTGAGDFSASTGLTNYQACWNINIGADREITLLSTINQGINSDFVVNGILNAGTNQISRINTGSPSSFTLNPGATLKTAHTAGITSDGSGGTVHKAAGVGAYTVTFSSGANYVYNGTEAQVTGTGLAQNTPANLTIDNPTSVTMSSATSISGDLEILQGTFNTNNLQIAVGGDWTNNGTYVSGTSTALFNGAAIQTITPGSGNFHSLTLNNANGILLEDNVVIANTLTMSNGNIVGNGNTITIGTSTANRGSISHTSGQVRGTLKRWFDTNTNNDNAGFFPLGNAGGDKFVSVAFTSAKTTGGTLTMYFNESPMGWQGMHRPYIEEVGSCGGFLVQSYADEGYWVVNPTDGMSNDGNYDITFEVTGFSQVNNLCEIAAIKRVNGGYWHNSGQHVENAGTTARPVIKRTGATGWSNWGLGGGESNPLPVELLDYSIACRTREVSLNWQTASEINNDFFILEKSYNGIDFEELSRIQGAGNSNAISTYQYTDKEGENKLKYYRLSQVDFDGTKVELGVRVANCSAVDNIQYSIYPNPFKDELIITSNTEEICKIEIMNYSGHTVYSELKTIEKNLALDLEHLKPGLYMLRITDESGLGQQVFKLIKN